VPASWGGGAVDGSSVNSNKGTKLLLKVIKAIIIIIRQRRSLVCIGPFIGFFIIHQRRTFVDRWHVVKWLVVGSRHGVMMMCKMFINNQNARKPPVTIGA